MNTHIPLEDVFDAYYDCRKHKKGRIGAQQFAVNLEENLIALWHDLNAGTWTPQPSTVFIIKKPVVREIFAASFRDRIVHHLVIRRLNPIFEQYFINDSYSCRVGKGTHYGINRAQHFIRSCSQNGKRSCYVLKLDLRGYFMSINRTVLFNKVRDCIDAYYTAPDKAERTSFISSVNSYLGILKHFKTYRKRALFLRKLVSPLWYKLVAISASARKIQIKKEK